MITVYGAARTADTVETYLSGLAVPFEQLSIVLKDKPARGSYREKFQCFAFAPELLRGEVLLTLHHEVRREFASVGGGSLRLWTDRSGLRFEANIRGSREMVAEALRCRGVSVSFRASEESWDWHYDMPIRTVINVAHLAEISLVSSPAYLTTYSCRGW